MKKRIITLALALLLIFALTACGGDKTEPTDPAAPQTDEGTPAAQPDSTEPLSGTKTLAFYNEYCADRSYSMEMKTVYEGVEYVTVSAYDNGAVYSKSNAGGTESIVIMKDGYQYILDPASKTCIKASSQMMQDTEEMFSDTMDSYAVAAATGDMDVDGASYYFEEFAVDGASVKYCFDGDTLKYIISSIDGEDYSAEILSMEKDPAKSLFEVPSDYTVVEY